MENLVDIHTPLKKLTIKEIQLKSKPLINMKPQNSMKYRDKLYSKFLKEQNIIKKQKRDEEYRIARHSVKFQIKNNKKLYYDEYFLRHKNNISNIWQGIKALVTLKEKSVNADINLECEFFVNIRPELANKIKRPNSSTGKLVNRLSKSIYLGETSTDEIIKIIKLLNSNKSLGPNSIPVHLIKCNADIISPPLSLLINQSFQQGTFPEICKIAKVIPVYKKGDKTLCSNNRPISLLSIFSKIFEKCIYSRFYQFLTKHNLIYKKQFGFRTNHSTNHAMVSLIETIKYYLDNGDYVCEVFIDLQKAFDTVDHEILLHKLFCYGIRSIANDWIRSFLTNRKQYVCVNGSMSALEVVTCGVPQGSTLGPLLFLIYINDLNEVFNNITVHHFADDTNLIFASKNPSTIETVMNFELKHLVNWLKDNKLSLNVSKTELIIFRPRKKPSVNVTIKLDKVKLKTLSSVTYLGIVIDELLSWNKQIDAIANKLSRTIGVLSKLRHFVSRNVNLSVYHSLFGSHINYGCLVWSFTSKFNLERLTKLQKKCLRILTFSDFDAHTNSLFSSTKILKLNDIVILEILKFMHDFKEGKLPSTLVSLFEYVKDNHNHLTRGSRKCNITIPLANTFNNGFNVFNGIKVLHCGIILLIQKMILHK